MAAHMIDATALSLIDISDHLPFWPVFETVRSRGWWDAPASGAILDSSLM